MRSQYRSSWFVRSLPFGTAGTCRLRHLLSTTHPCIHPLPPIHASNHSCIIYSWFIYLPPIHPLTNPLTHPSIHSLIHLPTHLSSIHPPIHWSIHPPIIHLPTYLPTHPSICPLTPHPHLHLSIRLSLYNEKKYVRCSAEIHRED